MWQTSMFAPDTQQRPRYSLDDVVFVRRIERITVQSCLDYEGFRTVEVRRTFIRAERRGYRKQLGESYPRRCDLHESTMLAALAALNLQQEQQK